MRVNSLKICLALVIGFSFFISGLASAGDPLTDYRFGHFAISVNDLYGSERSGFTVDATQAQLSEVASGSGNTLECVATVGVGHNFALEYRNWGINSALKPPTGYQGTVNTSLTNQEVAVLYRVGPRLWKDLADDVSSIFSGQVDAHDGQPYTRDIFAVVIGWDSIVASQSGNVTGSDNSGSTTMVNPPNSNRNSLVVGYEMSYQIFPKFYNSIRATYSFNNAFYGEFGYSYEIYQGLIFGGQFATKDIFSDGNGPQTDNFYMTGLMLGLTYQY